jgi:plasmid stability protein
MKGSGATMALMQNHLATENAVAASLSIKNVPEETLHRLRARAERNHRSLQMELLAIIEAATVDEGELTVDELAEYVKGLGISSPDDDVTAWIREFRDSR